MSIILALSVIFFRCSDRISEKKEDQMVYSSSQRYLFELLDSYKSEYFAANKRNLKDEVQIKYLQKIQHFLVDSLGRYIDSMSVTVDTVIQEGWLLTTQFHSRDIEFKYGMNFKDSMDSRNDSLYQWMKSLRPKSNLTVNFGHLGSVQLNFPDSSPKSIIRIFAFPEPLFEKP